MVQQAPAPTPTTPPVEVEERRIEHGLWVAQTLDPTKPLAPYFRSTAELRRTTERAHAMISAVSTNLKSKAWSLEIRTGCLYESDGSVILEGRALVRDQAGRIRALVEDPGTGDSASVNAMYYDEKGLLRAFVASWNNVMGASSGAVVTISADGHSEGCSVTPDTYDSRYCGDDYVEESRHRDPLTEFSKCNVPYNPTK